MRTLLALGMALALSLAASSANARGGASGVYRRDKSRLQENPLVCIPRSQRHQWHSEYPIWCLNTGSSNPELQAIKQSCGALVRAKYCGGAEIHCAPGPARVQANQQIQACIQNGSKL
jgi:hypothetical protein